MSKLAKLLGIDSRGLSVDKTSENAALPNATDILQVDVQMISANPYQPRKTFSEEGLQDLAASIREHGILQPILVRRIVSGYELVAGERRLRAARLSGLATVPVIVRELNDKEMAELAMIENLQREDLHFLEEAEGFHTLLSSFNFTQEDLAHRVGKSQSTIANKLRLLRLPPDVRQILLDDNLTERHARALLKLDDFRRQQEVLSVVHKRGLNVRETEDLVEDILEDIARENSQAVPKQRVVKVIRDVRIFLNTINSVVNEMKKVGLRVRMVQQQDDEFITISLKIPKRRK